MFKAQILAKLVTMYPGLPKQYLGTLADQMAIAVTEETQIEGTISNLNAIIPIEKLAAEWQKEGDRRATTAVETFKAGNPNPTNPVNPDPNNPTPPNPTNPAQTPEQKQLADLMAKVDAMEKKEAAQTSRQQLLAAMKLKGIPEVMAKNIQDVDLTKLDEIVTGLETDYKELQQSLVTEGLRANTYVPGGGGGGQAEGGPTSAAVAADIAAWGAKNTPPVTAPAAK